MKDASTGLMVDAETKKPVYIYVDTEKKDTIYGETGKVINGHVVLDDGKYKYAEAKKKHEAKLKQRQIQVKEVKFRPGTDEGDYQIKLRNLIRFLEEGDKTKVTLRFRGREMAHQEFGVKLLERVRTDLDPYGVVEQFPKLEGRQMIMVLSPKKKAVH